MSKKGRNHFFQPRNRIVRLMATEGRKRHNCERSPLPPILRQHPCGKITQTPKKGHNNIRNHHSIHPTGHT